MAWKNARQNRVAVDMLDVQPDDRILEVGFGPGTTVQAIAARVSRGFVAGIDRSEVMMRMASRRSRRLIEAGRVELRLGDVSCLPYDDATFTKALEVNSLHIWPDPQAGLREIHRVLRGGGLLVLCLRMKHPTRTRMVAPGYTEAEVEAVKDLLGRVGFGNIRTKVRQAGRQLTCVFASR